MDVNFLAILVCGILSLVIGFVWFGPIFGKKWMEINNVTAADIEARKKMQKRSVPLYIVTFVLALFQAYVLSLYINSGANTSGIAASLWIWGAFIIPTVAAGSMWNNDSSKVSWTKFWINAGYYLVLFVVFGLVLGAWK